MKEIGEELKSTLKALLNEKLSEREVQSLKDEGYKLKKPTRLAAVMIALYRKASSGDLSAIKEIRSMLSANDEGIAQGSVTIIDDV